MSRTCAGHLEIVKLQNHQRSLNTFTWACLATEQMWVQSIMMLSRHLSLSTRLGLLKGSFLGLSFQHTRNQPFNQGQWCAFVWPITQARGCGKVSETPSPLTHDPRSPANIDFTFAGSIADNMKGNLPALSKYLYYYHHHYLEEFKQRAVLCTKVWAAKGSGRWRLVILAVRFAHWLWQKSPFQQGRICTSAGTCDLSASLLVPTRSKLGAKLINSDESIRADRRLAALPQINPWVVGQRRCW